jgi:hypothetical protein
MYSARFTLKPCDYRTAAALAREPDAFLTSQIDWLTAGFSGRKRGKSLIFDLQYGLSKDIGYEFK